MEPAGRIFGPEETVSPLMLNPGDKHSHVMHTPQIVIPPQRPDSRRDAFGGAESATFGPRVCSMAKAHVTIGLIPTCQLKCGKRRWPPNLRYERDKRLRIQPVPEEWVRPWS